MPLKLAALSRPPIVPLKLTAPEGPVSSESTADNEPAPATRVAAAFATDPSLREPILLGLLLVFSAALLIPRLAPALGNLLNAHSDPWASLST
jgi:hypothetical protein